MSARMVRGTRQQQSMVRANVAWALREMFEPRDVPEITWPEQRDAWMAGRSLVRGMDAGGVWWGASGLGCGTTDTGTSAHQKGAPAKERPEPSAERGSRRRSQSDCDSVDAADACDWTQSQYAGTWTKWFRRGTGCVRFVTCEDYASSCDLPVGSEVGVPGNTYANSECRGQYDGSYAYEVVSWVFVPDEASSTGGWCWPIWRCVSLEDGELVDRGVTSPFEQDKRQAAMLDPVESIQTQSCSGPCGDSPGIDWEWSERRDDTFDDLPSCRVVLTRGYLRNGQIPPHLIVIYYNQYGETTVYEGQPSPGYDGPSVGNPAGRLDFGKLVSETKFVSPAYDDFVEVGSGLGTCFAQGCLDANAARIDGVYDYHPMGPNSNSFAYSLLANCGLAADALPEGSQFYPGWGQQL